MCMLVINKFPFCFSLCNLTEHYHNIPETLIWNYMVDLLMVRCQFATVGRLVLFVLCCLSDYSVRGTIFTI